MYKGIYHASASSANNGTAVFMQSRLKPLQGVLHELIRCLFSGKEEDNS